MKNWIEKYDNMPVLFDDCFLHVVNLLYPNVCTNIPHDTLVAGKVEVTHAVARLVCEEPQKVARRIMDRYRTYANEECQRIIQSMDTDLAKRLVRVQQTTESYKPSLQESLDNLNIQLLANQENVDKIVKANTIHLLGRETL